MSDLSRVDLPRKDSVYCGPAEGCSTLLCSLPLPELIRPVSKENAIAVSGRLLQCLS